MLWRKPPADIAKVGVEGSNPFARSNYLNVFELNQAFITPVTLIIPQPVPHLQDRPSMDGTLLKPADFPGDVSASFM
jgi:hypothetical protein